MDGDGELHLGDDVSASLPCASESGERHGGSTAKDAREPGANDSNNNGSSEDGAGTESAGDDDEEDDDDDEEEDEGEDDDDEDNECFQDVGEGLEDDGEDSDEDRMHIDIPEEGEEEDNGDDADSTDGGPSSSIGATVAVTEPATLTTEKRVPVQSQRMRDYHAMQQTASQSSRPRPCPWCERVLYSGPGYRYHLTTHRTGKESFSCDACRKKFKSFNGLKYHRKRKRCKGSNMDTPHTSSGLQASASPLPASTNARTLPQMPAISLEEEFHAQRLMELAKIATSPQSPLLQSPGPDSRGGLGRAFFDDSEASAVIALSSMRRSSESRKSLEACSSSHTPYTSSQLQQQQQHHQQQQQQQHHRPPAQDVKSKRPMNGFMLFAQQHRAELKKKYPDINNRMISTKLSEEWTRLPDAERQRWKDEARYRAELQLKEHPDCWKRKK